MHALTPQFTFAGFAFPRYVATLPTGPFARRIGHMKSPSTGGYYHAPKPLHGTHPGRGFYLEDAGQPSGRWTWADEIIHLRHTGWFCDEYQDQTMRGLVFRLPNGRGFLAGWSMGLGMLSTVDGDIHRTEEDAARAADSMAELAAELELEYQAQQDAEGEAA